MILENLRIALKAIRANKMRSVLTTLGIIIGVAAVIAVVSIVQGLNFVIASELQGVGATFIRVAPERDFNDPDLAGKEITLTYEDGLAVMAHSTALKYFNPVFFRSERVYYGDNKHTSTLLGVGPYHQEVNNHWVDMGRFFSELDIERHARVCLIGRKIISELGLGERPIGKDIIVGNASFTVVGIMEKKGEMFGQDRDDLVLIPITTARDIYGREALKQLILDFKAKSPAEVDLAKDQITQVLRRRHHIAEGKKNDFQVVLQEEILKTTGSILGTVTQVVGAVVGIALLVGGIGIMNIMLVSVTERTREIGIRKAVGARRSDILVQFLIEAVTLSLIGGLFGVLGGWVLGILGAKMIPGFPGAHVPAWAVFLGFGFAALVGVVFGTYPAAKASALDPIEALRYE
ncbi:MAG: ABC transporter permease [Acidobacteria bacterium]|jgi:putative ABC transport system permease protein|nr:ABC transporter permease [Acidobacteriota bacterium]